MVTSPSKATAAARGCYPFLALCVCVRAVFSCVQAICQCLGFSTCTWLLMCVIVQEVCKHTWSVGQHWKLALGEKSFSSDVDPCQLVLHLAFCSDASPAEQHLFPQMFSSSQHDGWFKTLDAAVGCRSWVKFRLTVYGWFIYLFFNQLAVCCWLTLIHGMVDFLYIQILRSSFLGIFFWGGGGGV